MIEKRHGVKFDLNNIPLDDPKAFELMGSGQTAGVFQVEGSGMTRYLVQMKPKTLDNIIAMVALYRPGPMDFIPDYIARMHGEAEVEYRHPKLEPIFKDTYGIPVYQEQLMRAAVELAGYTPSESDDLRKAISKKKKEEIEKHRKKFVEGAVKQGMEKEIAEADLQGLGGVRPLRFQQESRGGLRRDRGRDRLSESPLHRRVYDGAALGQRRARPSRSPYTLRMRAAWASLSCRRRSMPRSGIFPSKMIDGQASHSLWLGRDQECRAGGGGIDHRGT